jgi:[ribosomal protein S18]-alanine N-acetyltransferase
VTSIETHSACSSPLEIVPAEPADREWCARLMASTEPWLRLGRGLAECRERCSDPQYVLRLALLGGERCGFLLLHPRGVAGSPYVASIAVDAQIRGRGIGTALMEWAEQRSRIRGARHIFLCVSSFNPRARLLYQRLGYVEVAELAGYVIPEASEILMHKALDRL